MKNLHILLTLVVVVLGVVCGAPGETTGGKCRITFNTLCEANQSNTCKTTSYPIDGYWEFGKLKILNISLIDVDKPCKLVLCDDFNLMGYCVQITYLNSINAEYVKKIGNILGNESLSATCFCGSNKWDDTVTKNDVNFDRNYVGVVYSPYDKYWERNGTNGTLFKVSWSNYTEDEIRTALEVISTKFTYISTKGMGTTYACKYDYTFVTNKGPVHCEFNSYNWYDGHKIAFVPKVAAEINKRKGYPALRVAVGIFRQNNEIVFWNRKELTNGIEAAKQANQIFNGTAWGIIVTSDYVTDVRTANDALGMIDDARQISDSEGLRFQIGIRISNADFIAAARTDFSFNPNAAYISFSPFHNSLRDIVKKVDFLVYTFSDISAYNKGQRFSEMVRQLQRHFLKVRDSLRKINPRVKVIIETGFPSGGVGNGFDNSVAHLKEFWYGMAAFGKNNDIIVSMIEAVDEPWKNSQDSGSEMVESEMSKGPNGTEGFYGWWKRLNNSLPLVYIEKITEMKDNLTFSATTESGGEQVAIQNMNPEPGSRLDLIWAGGLCLVAIIAAFVVVTGYLLMKLRKSKKQIISPAYVSQFLSGDASVNKNEYYAVALRIPYDRRYELAENTFKLGEFLGSGQTGRVFLGEIKSRSRPVAFKCTSPASTISDIKSIMSEIKILSYIGNHPNILCILGAYTKKIERGIVYLAVEYCPLGSLESFLRKHKRRNTFALKSSVGDYKNYWESDEGSMVDNRNTVVLNYVTTEDISSDYSDNGSISTHEDAASDYDNDSENHLNLNLFNNWAYQIASAMEYVSAKNVIHADLACRNVLLVDMNNIKICDFGLSQVLYRTRSAVHDQETPVPWMWMAPESLKQHVFSVESDVWSFGVTVWEIFSLAEVPFPGYSYNMQFIRELHEGTIRLSRAKYASEEIHQILTQCWNSVPDNRPSFAALKAFFLDQTVTNSNDFI